MDKYNPLSWGQVGSFRFDRFIWCLMTAGCQTISNIYVIHFAIGSVVRQSRFNVHRMRQTSENLISLKETQWTITLSAFVEKHIERPGAWLGGLQIAAEGSRPTIYLMLAWSLPHLSQIQAQRKPWEASRCCWYTSASCFFLQLICVAGVELQPQNHWTRKHCTLLVPRSHNAMVLPSCVQSSYSFYFPNAPHYQDWKQQSHKNRLRQNG